jgi:hypothetical protein
MAKVMLYSVIFVISYIVFTKKPANAAKAIRNWGIAL